MSQQFIGREDEIAYLERRYASREPEFIVLYGRRRIGKTELALHFLGGKRGLYYLASKEGDRENIGMLAKEMSKLVNDSAFAAATYPDWHSLFSSFVSHRGFAGKGKTIIVIDEFPYLIHSNSAMPSVFQRIWELHLRKENVMLILLGSSVSVMEAEVLSTKSPLYGRRTGQWRLSPLPFRCLRSFFPSYGMGALLMAWAITGGVPEYLKKLSAEKGIFENIRDHVLRRGEYLHSEAEIILNEEFREPKNYKLILRSLSQGRTRLNEITGDTGLDKGMVSKYLDMLEQVAIISEESPLTASQKSRGKRYAIADPFFTFWFRYVYPNRVDIEAQRVDAVVELVRKDFPLYMGTMFERFVREHLPLLLKGTFTRSGREWGKTRNGVYDIDVVAINDSDSEILFGECKWQDRVDAAGVLAELKRKAQCVQWRSGRRKERYAIFARSFKSRQTAGAELVDLAAMEKALFRAAPR